MPELGTSGSVGAPGGKPPGATRLVTIYSRYPNTDGVPEPFLPDCYGSGSGMGPPASGPPSSLGGDGGMVGCGVHAKGRVFAASSPAFLRASRSGFQS